LRKRSVWGPGKRLPDWWADARRISLYYASRTLRPRKAAAFVEAITAHFHQSNLARRFSAAP
jgi:hypothetical protein